MEALSVLHVSQPTDAGVPQIVADLIRDQVRRGWRVGVACPPEGQLPAWIKEAGAEHFEWRSGRAPGPAVPLEMRRLGRCIDAFGPRLVHLHSSKAGLVGRLVIRRSVPTVFQPHAWSFEALQGPLARLAGRWERSATRWTSAIVCVSDAEKAMGESVGIVGEWRVIPNGVDLDRFGAVTAAERRSVRERLGFPDAPSVVCVGRLSEQKGQDILLDAWPLVLAEVPDARLYLVGGGPLGPQLKARGVRHVDFLGQRSDVPTLLAAANVIAMPSRWEGCSLAMLEALGRGRSVVSSDVSGAWEAIDGDAGAVVPIGEVGALSDAIVTRLKDLDTAEREGEIGRRRAEERHDVIKMVERVAALYRELLG
jgi:glycosyltransferase involved in cell wall biosynthesis